jgi:hypothetical protein
MPSATCIWESFQWEVVAHSGWALSVSVWLMGLVSTDISDPYEYNTTLTAIFLKTYDQDTLQCPYKDYSILDRWQANRDLLSVTMHLCQGKKVSLLPSGDVNPGPVPSRWGCLSTVPIMR